MNSPSPQGARLVASANSYKWINKDAAKIKDIIRKLAKLVKENVNTKVEIKLTARDLEYQANHLIDTIKDCEREDLELEANRQRLEQTAKETEDKGTQANFQDEEEDEREALLKLLREGGKREDIDAAMQKEWPNDIYRATREETAYPVKLDDGWDLVVLLNQTESWDRGLGKMVSARYPEAKELHTPGETAQNEISYLTNTTEVKLSSGRSVEKSKRVYILSHDPNEDDIALLSTFQKLKEETVRESRRKIIFAAADGLDRSKCRKMMELMYHNEETEITCRVPANSVRNEEEQKKQTTNSTVMINAGNETYANLLRRVKNSVDIDKIGVDVKKIEKRGRKILS